jgi:hypothetical protein
MRAYAVRLKVIFIRIAAVHDPTAAIAGQIDSVFID